MNRLVPWYLLCGRNKKVAVAGGGGACRLNNWVKRWWERIRCCFTRALKVRVMEEESDVRGQEVLEVLT
jgi:hypothetical protein